MQRFDGKVVWITGASAGIGAALAREFAKRGAILCLSARRVDKLQELAAELAESKTEATIFPCDVTVEQDLVRTVQAIIDTHGHLDVAVANAGLAVRGRIESLSAQEWRRQFEANVIGSALTAKYALSELRRSNGRMVLIGSVMSMMSVPKSGAYSASKHAIRSIGQTLSLELHGSGVSCTTIHPGLVASDIAKVDNEGVFDASRTDGRSAKFMWTAEKAAKVMVDAIGVRKREYVFTNHGKLGAYLGRHFPGLLHFAQTLRPQ